MPKSHRRLFCSHRFTREEFDQLAQTMQKELGQTYPHLSLGVYEIPQGGGG